MMFYRYNESFGSHNVDLRAICMYPQIYKFEPKSKRDFMATFELIFILFLTVATKHSSLACCSSDYNTEQEKLSHLSFLGYMSHRSPGRVLLDPPGGDR